MSNTKNNNGLKIALGIALLLLLSLGIYTLSGLSNANKLEEITKEKGIVIDDLKSMSKNYELALKESELKDEKLVEAKKQIDQLIDSVETSKVTIKSLLKYKLRQAELDSEMKLLIRENKELKQDNEILVGALEKRKKQLKNTKLLASNLKAEKEALETEKTGLNSVISKAAYLNMVNLEAFGVRERKSGKQVLTNKARRVNKLKVCYTLSKNSLVKAGTKKLNIQVIGPDNKLVVSKNTPNDNKGEYTYVTTFVYDDDNVNVCDFISLKGDEKFNKGSYTVNVYDKDKFVTKTVVTLK